MRWREIVAVLLVGSALVAAALPSQETHPVERVVQATPLTSADAGRYLPTAEGGTAWSVQVADRPDGDLEVVITGNGSESRALLREGHATMRSAVTVAGEWSMPTPLATGDVQKGVGLVTRIEQTRDGAVGLPCALALASGMELRAGDEVTLDPPCHPWPTDGDSRSVDTLVVARVGLLDGDDVAMVTGQAGNDTVLQLVYRAGLSLPLQVSHDNATWVMEASEAAALTPGPWFEPPQITPVERRPWGPDDAGWSGFPPSVAWRLMDQVERARSFREAHPDAVLQRASYEFRSAEQAVTGPSERWSFIVCAEDCLRMDAERQAVPTVNGPWDPLLGSVRETMTDLSATPVENKYADSVSGPTPSLASLVDAYARLTDGDEFSSIDYRFDGPEPGVAIGFSDPADIWLAPGDAVSGGQVTSQTVRFGTDGRFEAIDQESWTESYGLMADARGSDPLAPIAHGDDGFVWWTAGRATTVLVSLGIAALLYRAPLTALFSRINPDNALRNKVRATIIEAVENDPGLHKQELARRLGLGAGALDYHLHVLCATSHLVAARSGGYTCYFPAGGCPPTWAGALRSKTARRLLASLSEGPMAVGQLRQAVGISYSGVMHHLRRLEAGGVVEQAPERWRLTDEGRRALGSGCGTRPET